MISGVFKYFQERIEAGEIPADYGVLKPSVEEKPTPPPRKREIPGGVSTLVSKPVWPEARDADSLDL